MVVEPHLPPALQRFPMVSTKPTRQRNPPSISPQNALCNQADLHEVTRDGDKAAKLHNQETATKPTL